jgi:hypothetical protein
MNKLTLEWRLYRGKDRHVQCWLEYIVDGSSLAEMLVSALQSRFDEFLKNLKPADLKNYAMDETILHIYPKTEPIGNTGVLRNYLDRELDQITHKYPHPYSKKHLDYLLAKRKPNVAQSDRVPFYTCPECGDYDCGLIGAHVRRIHDCIQWSDLRQIVYGTYIAEPEQWKPGMDDCAVEWADIGPFTFKCIEYEQCLRNPPPIPEEILRQLHA